MVLASLVSTTKTRNLGKGEYLLYKQLIVLFRDSLTVNIPSLRTPLKKMCDDM
jgi:hypothetical protein